MKKKMILQFLEMSLGVTFTALGITLMIKSGLGQTAVTAFTQNVCKITNMKSGTFLIIFNMLCVILQILILRKDFKKLQLIQIVIAYLQGQMVNIFCYEIPFISTMHSDQYFMVWIWMLCGILFASYGVAMMMVADLVKHPFEELCMILSRKWNIEFSSLRMYADMFFMLLCFMLVILFHLDFSTLREGTWASMLLLGKSMMVTFPLARQCSLYKRWFVSEVGTS